MLSRLCNGVVQTTKSLHSDVFRVLLSLMYEHLGATRTRFLVVT